MSYEETFGKIKKNGLYRLKQKVLDRRGGTAYASGVAL